MSTERITLTPTDCTPEFADRLDLDPIDIDYITNESNAGACYTFTAAGTANTGSAYIDSAFVAIEWGGDPQWYLTTTEAQQDDTDAVTLAINGDLPEA